MRRWPRFSKSDYRGFAVMGILMLLLIILGWWQQRKEGSISQERQSFGETETEKAFFDSIQNSRRDKKTFIQNQTPQLFRFNPNKADSATFVKLGLPEWLAGRIIHYRNAGGKFRKPTDLGKIYGFREETLQRLLPFISIPEDENVETSQKVQDSEKRESQPKAAIQSVDINRADSLQLINIPGIGPYYAHRILRYRQLLGGFVNKEQLLEINNFPNETLTWMYVQQNETKKLHVNSFSFKDLLRHPYLNFEQVKSIVRHREKFGDIKSLNELSNYNTFTEKEIERLLPYVSYE